MERFMMFDDRPIDSFLVMQLSDLARTLAQNRHWTVEFAAHSGVHLTRPIVYVSRFWDVYPAHEKEAAIKSDVVLRLIGTRRHTDVSAVQAFRQAADAQPLPKLAKQLFSFAEDLRLEMVCERERPGTKRWFRVRRRLYRRYFAQQWQANQTRSALADQFLAAMYLRLTADSPLDDVPLAPMAEEAVQTRLQTLWTQWFDASSTTEVAQWALALTELMKQSLHSDLVHDYTSLPFVSDAGQDEQTLTIDDIKRTDPLENDDALAEANGEVKRQTLPTWHRETSRTGGSFLRFELERGSRTGMMGDGARPGDDGDQALAIVQGTSQPTNRNDYGLEAHASFNDHPRTGSGAPYGEANRRAELVLVPFSPPSPVHLEQYRAKQAAVAPYRKRLVRVMEQWLEHQRSAWRTNLPAGRLRKQLVPFFTDERPRLFYKKGEPARRFDAVFGLLVDCSASMHDKMEETKTGLVLCHEALKTLRVPHAIVGFWEDANEATAAWQPNYMQTAVSFRRSLEPSSGPAIMQLEPHEDNRDGLAIRWMTEQLLGRPERQKVLLVFSDGEPAAYGYEQNGIIDTHEAVADARRRGIEVVNLFLGRGADDESTRRTVENIYGRFRVFVPHVSELADRLLPLLKAWLQKSL
ncbi:cobaltochelatase CobT-related protein [Geobacillus sp. YF-1]|uniref:cobaltochelatase CobT-related protein n=1 Tax=Geobacillus sp. YF-1 TaxID=3457480 RepID=UPI004045E73E